MVDGDLIGAFALTEAESGSDAFNMSTKAEKNGNYYLVNGCKMFISNGRLRMFLFVLARTEKLNLQHL